MELIIDKAFVNCEVNYHSHPSGLGRDLDGLLRRDILPLMEEILESSFPESTHFELSKVQFSIVLNATDERLEKVSVPMLRSALSQQILAQFNENATRSNAEEFIWKQFIFIIKNGYTPWSFTYATHEDFERQLLRNSNCLNSDIGIREEVRKAISNADHLQRISNVFSFRFTLALLKVLYPNVMPADEQILPDIKQIAQLSIYPGERVLTYVLLAVAISSFGAVGETGPGKITAYLKKKFETESGIGKVKEGKMPRIQTREFERAIKTLITIESKGPVLISEQKKYDAGEDPISKSADNISEEPNKEDGKEKKDAVEKTGLTVNKDENTITGNEFTLQEDELLMQARDKSAMAKKDHETADKDVEITADANKDITTGTGDETKIIDEKLPVEANDEKDAITGAPELYNTHTEKMPGEESNLKQANAREKATYAEQTKPNPPITFDKKEQTWQRDGVYLHNAGLVILAPFLPNFFRQLGLVEDGKLIKPHYCVYMLQLLCGTEEEKEYNLVLNKILCGLEPEEILNLPGKLEEKDIEESRLLLEAVIKHWSALKSTRPETLQHVFLRRDGKLENSEGKVTLYVAGKTEDVLMDFLPWSIGFIKLTWMKYAINVKWNDKTHF